MITIYSRSHVTEEAVILDIEGGSCWPTQHHVCILVGAPSTRVYEFGYSAVSSLQNHIALDRHQFYRRKGRSVCEEV